MTFAEAESCSARARAAMAEAAPRTLVDRYGRTKTYLRLSVTPACDMRCTYCTPDTGVPLPRSRVLGKDAIVRIARVAASLGITRIRITGGEPLLRPDVVDIVGEIAALRGVDTVAMTTNGQRLASRALALRGAGLASVNVSVDSLDPVRYRTLTGGGALEPTLAGIAAARSVGLGVKVNAVALADLSAAQAEALIERWAPDEPIEVRFLEVMPLSGSGWSEARFMSLEALQWRLVAHYDLRPLPGEGGIAQRFGRPDWRGTVGFIRSLTAPFCGTCSRLRVTAWGELRPCLFSPISVQLGPALAEKSDEALERLFVEATAAKPKGHGLAEADRQPYAARKLTWIRHTGG